MAGLFCFQRLAFPQKNLILISFNYQNFTPFFYQQRRSFLLIIKPLFMHGFLPDIWGI